MKMPVTSSSSKSGRAALYEALDRPLGSSWRLFWERWLTRLCHFFSMVALIPLLSILLLLVGRGLPLISWHVFVGLPPPPGIKGGGFGNALVGTALMVGMAMTMASPLGILAAIYIAEYQRRGRLASAVRFSAKLLTGIPSIICGVFAFSLVVLTMKHFSALAGSVALFILALPTIILTAEQALRGVPETYREASYGLGATRFQTICRIILPKAAPGIFTGLMLAAARTAGETAPLLITALFSFYWNVSPFQETASLSVLIYNYATLPYDYQVRLAWTVSLVLVLLVTLANVATQRILVRER